MKPLDDTLNKPSQNILNIDVHRRQNWRTLDGNLTNLESAASRLHPVKGDAGEAQAARHRRHQQNGNMHPLLFRYLEFRFTEFKHLESG